MTSFRPTASFRMLLPSHHLHHLTSPSSSFLQSTPSFASSPVRYLGAAVKWAVDHKLNPLFVTTVKLYQNDRRQKNLKPKIRCSGSR
ncbi:hypothetical protein L1887_02459 [Cichorium endivia]|nr:hypothetical protein L1887_02459 [Cichorium endivia]